MFLFLVLGKKKKKNNKSAAKLEQEYFRHDKQLRFVIPNDKDPVFHFFDM